MAKRQMLSDDELDKVSGGSNAMESDFCGGDDYVDVPFSFHSTNSWCETTILENNLTPDSDELFNPDSTKQVNVLDMSTGTAVG